MPKKLSSSTKSSRRNFLQQASVGAAGLLSTSVLAKADVSARPSGVPAHLPRRLAICYYGWDWITSALPDEPYGNLDRALAETKERGFNCVRAEVGLNWMFDFQGQRRGRLKFLNWIPGFSDNLQCVDAKGGGEFDVFERVMQLFQLAQKNGLHVITTSWEYQDAISHLANARLRDELLAVPYNQRLMLLARQYDRLLKELGKRNLHGRIAQVELINELNSPPIVCSPSAHQGQTMTEWVKGEHPACTTEEVRELAGRAVAYLRERYPQLLITVDGLSATRGFDNLFPESAQVADHHLYVDGVTQAFWRAAGISGIRAGEPPDPEHNAFLRSMLKPHLKSWNELVRNASRVRQGWWRIAWLYTNLDNRKFDEWCVANYPQYRRRVQDSLDKQFRAAAEFAQPRKLPLIVDEGFILYPPLHSRFVTTPQGRWGEEAGVNGAIATGHWGIMLSGYFRPNTPVWKDSGQVDWARRVNARILSS